MGMRQNAVIGATILILVVAGSLLYYLNRRGVVPSTTSDSATTTSTTVATSSTGSVLAKGSGDYTIKVIPTKTPAPVSPLVAPDYKVPLTFASSIGADQRAALNARLALDQAALAKDAYDFSTWIDLGTLHETAGDYSAARIILEYVSKTWPSNIVSFNNLGDLYMNYIHDYPAAESNYLKQVANRPSDVNAYTMLFTLYSELYKKNTSAAEDILRKGIAANPEASDLKAMLDTYLSAKTSP